MSKKQKPAKKSVARRVLSGPLSQHCFLSGAALVKSITAEARMLEQDRALGLEREKAESHPGGVAAYYAHRDSVIIEAARRQALAEQRRNARLAYA